MNFDHEVSNYLFYRTLIDPYKWFWDNDNTKWDIIDLARAFYALRPDGVKWPMKEGGGPSFRLGDLCEANEIPMVQAHDAVSDVIATFELARVLKRAQPRLFNYYFSLRSKHAVNQIIRKGSRIVHVNSFIPAVDGCVGVYYVLGRHPVNSNSVIAVNLLEDLAPFSDLSPEEISARLYKKKVNQEPGEKRPPLTDIKTNKSPFVAEYRTLSAESKQRFNIDDDVIDQRERFIRENTALQSRILKSYTVAEFPAATDVDVALYDGFIPKNDGWLLSEIHAAPLDHLNVDVSRFSDNRLPKLVKRFFARSFPERLSPDDLSGWQQHCRQQVFDGGDSSASAAFHRRIEELKAAGIDEPDEAILNDLLEYEAELRGRLSS
jgi:exodeoxyribonuclease-1